MNAGNGEASGDAPILRPLWRHPAFPITLLALSLLAATRSLWWPTAEAGIFELEFVFAGWLEASSPESPGALRFLLLPGLGFLGGLLASISPCVLPLVPLNIAYIGAQDADGPRALGLSLRFAIGAALALSILGIFGDLAGFLLIEQRGPVLLIAGLALLYFGLVLAELAPDPIGGHDLIGARRLGPVGAGAAFSLVTTPCTSPILGAVLVATAAQPTPGLGVATMVAFSFGYTLLVFLGGVFGGDLIARARRIHADAPRAATAALLIGCGAAFAWTGYAWF